MVKSLRLEDYGELRKNPRIRPGRPFRFKCIRCDVCCGTGPNVHLSVFDVVRMAHYLDVDVVTFLHVYTNLIIAAHIPHIGLAGDVNGRCVFLGFDGEGRTYCKIYPARPMKCRLYPGLPIAPGHEELELDTKCPGLEEAGEGEESSVPTGLYRQYVEEMRMHYRFIFEEVVNKGRDPVDALYGVLRKLAEDLKSGRLPDWADLDRLEKMGYT